MLKKLKKIYSQKVGYWIFVTTFDHEIKVLERVFL